MPIKVVRGKLPQTQGAIYCNGKKAGKFLNGIGDIGIALIRLEFLTNSTRRNILECGDSLIEAVAPKWFETAKVES